MSALYELGDALTTAMREIEEQLEASGGEFTEAMQERLDAAEGDWSAKVEKVALYVRDTLMQAEAADAEATRLTNRRNGLRKRAEWLRDTYLRHAMESQGRDEVRGSLVTVKIRQGPPSANALLPLGVIPMEYVRVTPEKLSLNKEAVLAAHREGKPLPEGISITRSKSVRIS